MTPALRRMAPVAPRSGPEAQPPEAAATEPLGVLLAALVPRQAEHRARALVVRVLAVM